LPLVLTFNKVDVAKHEFAVEVGTPFWWLQVHCFSIIIYAGIKYCYYHVFTMCCMQCTGSVSVILLSICHVWIAMLRHMLSLWKYSLRHNDVADLPKFGCIYTLIRV
jgi:hypothetical protein